MKESSAFAFSLMEVEKVQRVCNGTGTVEGTGKKSKAKSNLVKLF
jgi:hypothetical protein